ncbi:hypothetical protein SteCoe_30637 [Stentor coeruleus]|uniref:RING-type E3 ubiquitin transferase n=1 Tax=Stentor coeruleus TaxID=5963 RepID=A0A1R2B395_9CILI|nr:hypothetical protein SteCoe_30637 [Stentor coeruleus]
MSSFRDEDLIPDFQNTNPSLPITRKRPRLSENFYSFLICPVCYEYLSPPVVRCPRDHNICYDCISRIAHLSNGMKCPECRSLIDQNSHNRVLEEQLKELLITCKWKKLGCKEEISLSDIRAHARTCIYRPGGTISCLFNHPDEPEATHCSWIGRTINFTNHLEEIHSVSLFNASQHLRFIWCVPTNYQCRVIPIRLSLPFAGEKYVDFVLQYLYNPTTKLLAFIILSLNQDITLNYSIKIIDHLSSQSAIRFRGCTNFINKIDLRKPMKQDIRNIFQVSHTYIESIKYQEPDETDYFQFIVKFLIKDHD